MSQTLFADKQKLFDRWAKTYDFFFPSVFYRAVHQRLLEFVELPPKAKILDLGCGTGRLLNRLGDRFPDLTGTGLDFSSEMLARAQQQNRHGDRMTFVEGNTDALPFPDSQFDAVFSTISFLHYPQPQKVLTEIHRVLLPEGRFYWADHSLKQEWNREDVPMSPGGIHLYSSQKRETLAREAKLDCAGHHYLLFSVLLSVFIKEHDK
ncbi:MAG: class I SAM-dependent methyltransferase [Spirulina sp.]